MDNQAKGKVKMMITKHLSEIWAQYLNVKNSIETNRKETVEFMHALIAQIPQSSTDTPLKTPRVLRKRGIQQIKTIPEDEVLIVESVPNSTVDPNVICIKTEVIEQSEMDTVKPKRKASKKAIDNIRKQQSFLLKTKLRRPEDDNDISSVKKVRQSKRKLSSRPSSDEEEQHALQKHSKLDDTVSGTISKTDSKHERSTSSNSEKQSKGQKSSISNGGINTKEVEVVNDTVVADESLYEDAYSKPIIPVMNSTMKHNSTIVLDKIMNATVVLERLSDRRKLNETVTIQKGSLGNNSENKSEKNINQTYVHNEKKNSNLLESSKSSVSSKPVLENRMQQLKKTVANKEFDELITDDESSPDVKISKYAQKKTVPMKAQSRRKSSISSSDDEVLNTPVKKIGTHATKTAYKKNALFSPYAEESVKKRVKAFEEAGNIPKSVDIDAPPRLTRTKTRAMAQAAQAEADGTDIQSTTIAQKLARKSLAKAKRISLAKQRKEDKESEEFKENMQETQKANYTLNDKLHHKPLLKTTPLSKIKSQLPLSVNRIPQTPNENQIHPNQSKAMSAMRSNIVTSVESFLQPLKTATKQTSETPIEKRRKVNDEDARQKRIEVLRLQTEERKRKREEKELKNKLAREAKEKQEMEKRLKAEKEREEKARIAQQMQEKLREEAEKKRLAHLQRVQEKEERRKIEEKLRLQRLREQEEAERLFAEQRRKEQEAEKRKEAEAKAQQQAAAEAIKLKQKMLVAQLKARQLNACKQQGPTSYVLDSEPDNDRSDDESNPKHQIPFWAQSHIRKKQLEMQQYIPEQAVLLLFGTQKCTPDLSELFHGIDKSRLKRTSSAIWRTPPRYSMMEEE